MTKNTLFILVVAGLGILALLAYLVDRLLLWMERKGWIYYRNCEPDLRAGVRGVMGTFQELVQPEIRHVKEEMEQRKAESDDKDPSDH